MTFSIISIILALGLSLTAAENPFAKKKEKANEKKVNPTTAAVPSVGVHPFFALPPISPPSSPATGSFNGLHRESNFLHQCRNVHERINERSEE